jgi:hypothetical protein
MVKPIVLLFKVIKRLHMNNHDNQQLKGYEQEEDETLILNSFKLI